MRWNLTQHGSGWLAHPDSINEIGCIHVYGGCGGAGVVTGGNRAIVRVTHRAMGVAWAAGLLCGADEASFRPW
jgi:hypothetical protein